MGVTILLVCLGIVLCWNSVLAQKTHTLSIVKLDSLEAEASWMENSTMWLSKKDKQVKMLNWKATFKQSLTSDVMCKWIDFGKVGGKFVKITEGTEKPCCESVASNSLVWQCIKKFSNFPDRCPMSEGEYSIINLDLNQCNLPVFLPPKSPEEHKITFSARLKDKIQPVVSVTVYGTAKMKTLLG